MRIPRLSSLTRRVGAGAVVVATVAAYVGLSAGVASAAPSLQFDKRASVATAAPGEVFTFALRYRCASITEACTDAQILDVLPASMEFVSLPPVGGHVTNVWRSGNTIAIAMSNPLAARSSGLLTVAA